MTLNDQGGPAYPSGDYNGMSLRDCFAASALNALVSSGWDENSDASIAARAYAIADAMLVQRAEQEDER